MNMRIYPFIVMIICLVACTNPSSEYWKPYDETAELQANQTHENQRMQFQLIQSKLLDKNDLWVTYEKALNRFGEDQYQALKPLIIEQDIPTLQSHIKSGLLSYEKLTLLFVSHTKIGK